MEPIFFVVEIGSNPTPWSVHTAILLATFHSFLLVFLLSAGNGFANISLQEGGGKEPILTTAKKNTIFPGSLTLSL